MDNTSISWFSKKIKEEIREINNCAENNYPAEETKNCMLRAKDLLYWFVVVLEEFEK